MPVATSLNTESTTQLIIDVVIQDHDELRDYHKRYTEANNDHDRQKWFYHFQWQLARHAVGEELILYPAYVRNLGAEGRTIVDEDRAEHMVAKELLYNLDNTSVSDPNHSRIFERLFEALSEHMKGEEEYDLPKLEYMLSYKESAALANSFLRTKKFAPTRSHPKPPFENAASLLAAPIDKLRDLYRTFPKLLEW